VFILANTRIKHSILCWNVARARSCCSQCNERDDVINSCDVVLYDSLIWRFV